MSKYHFYSKNFCFSGWPLYWQRNYLRLYGLFEAMHSNLYTLGVITDIAQAFDTVDHTIFLKKPELHGLEDNAQNLIKILFTKQETMSCNRPQIEKQFQIVVFPKDQYWDPFRQWKTLTHPYKYTFSVF